MGNHWHLCVRNLEIQKSFGGAKNSVNRKRPNDQKRHVVVLSDASFCGFLVLAWQFCSSLCQQNA